MKSKPKKKVRKQRAASAPKPKHVTIEAEQRLLIHVVKGGKPVAEYIAGAGPEGVVTMHLAPEAPAPVMTPSPISGT
jgi:hypothetical protein